MKKISSCVFEEICMRKTKIICTIGPATDDYGILLKLAENMDIARFNFSHGSKESHKKRLEMLRKASAETGRPVAAMLDTKGPEIRTGLLENHRPVTLEREQKIIVTTADCIGNKEKISVTYKELPRDIRPGDHILIDDGLLELIMEKVKEPDIFCKIYIGGQLGEKKGVHVPGLPLRLPSLTDKDREDILFAIENDFDFIAASFVRNAAVIEEIKNFLASKNSPIKIIAKIESEEGVRNFDDILKAADAVMVARGDLGVDMAPERLPQIQKDIIKKCNAEGKPVITATQMLDSMIRNPRPTRAEITDVANAVGDGTDAVMLSGETAAGKYPAEALNVMAAIAEFTENSYIPLPKKPEEEKTLYDQISDTVCRAAVESARKLGANAIIAPTLSGNTARLLSKYRPGTDIFALSPYLSTIRQMMLLWGVRPILAVRYESTDTIFEKSLEKVKEEGYIKENDLVVITAGILPKEKKEKSADTNIMRIMKV